MKKSFDAVAFQRKVREEMSKEYLADPQTFLRRLKEKYGDLRKEKAGAPSR